VKVLISEAVATANADGQNFKEEEVLENLKALLEKASGGSFMRTTGPRRLILSAVLWCGWPGSWEEACRFTRLL
jgi:hypothetical protein